jgi:hypothetical protein
MWLKNPSEKEEGKTGNEQEEEIRRHSFVLHCTALPPYYLLWTSFFSQQDYTNVCLLAIIKLLFLD